VALTRRKFLTACGATLAVSVTGHWAHVARTVIGRKHWMASELTLEFFEKHVGETFTVSHEQTGDVDLKLARTMDVHTPFKKHHGTPAMEAFAVHFEGPTDKPLHQATFRFAHPEAGTFDLFMVPVVSRDPGVRRYEVAISRVLA
jgi:hypothetical protein